MSKPEDVTTENGKVDVKAEAQRNKMDETGPSKPVRRDFSHEPNAGGGNREAGDRKGR